MANADPQTTGRRGARITAFGPVARSYLSHARLLWSTAPVASLAALALTLLGAAASTAGIVLLGKVIGAGIVAVGHPDPVAAHNALGWLVWLAISFLVPPIVSGFVSVLAQHITATAVARVTALTVEYADAPAGIDHLEDPDRSRRLHRMAQSIGEWTYLEGIAGTWTVLQTRLSGVGAFAVIAGWHWWAAVLLAAGYLITGRAMTAWLLSIFADMALDPPIGRRRASYLFDLLMKSDAAKEIRLFGLPGWMINSYSRLWQEAMTGVWRRRNATIGPVLASTAVMGVCAIVFFWLLGRGAWTGAIPAATVTALVGASIGMQALGMLGDEQVLFSQAMATTEQLRAARVEAGLPGMTYVPDKPQVTGPAGHQPARSGSLIFISAIRAVPSRSSPVSI